MKKVATFIGAASGVVFGLLFAKKSGKELRTSLAKSKNASQAAEILGKALVDAGKESITELKNFSNKEEVQDFIKKSKQKLKEIESQLEQEGKKALAKFKTEATKKVQDIKTQVQKKQKQVQKAVSKKAAQVKKNITTKK